MWILGAEVACLNWGGHTEKVCDEELTSPKGGVWPFPRLLVGVSRPL